MAKLPKPEELSKIDYTPPKTSWMDTPVVIKEGMFCHGAKPPLTWTPFRLAQALSSVAACAGLSQILVFLGGGKLA